MTHLAQAASTKNRTTLRYALSAMLTKQNYFVCAQGHYVFVTFPEREITMTEIEALLPKHVLEVVSVSPRTDKNIVQIYINL